MTTLFTKIINKELPSYEIIQNDLVLAILTLEQINLGHTLVIPKIEVDHFSDVPEPYYSEIFKLTKHLSKAIAKVTNCQRVISIFQGFEVPHCHLHLIPANDPTDLDFRKGRKFSHEECLKVQDGIRAELEKFLS